MLSPAPPRRPHHTDDEHNVRKTTGTESLGSKRLRRCTGRSAPRRDTCSIVAGGAVSFLLCLHLGKLRRTDISVFRKTLTPDDHAVGSSARFEVRPGTVSRLLGVADFRDLAAVGELGPRASHAPEKLNAVQLQLGQLVDLSAEILQARVPANPVATVYPAIFERWLHPHI